MYINTFCLFVHLLCRWYTRYYTCIKGELKPLSLPFRSVHECLKWQHINGVNLKTPDYIFTLVYYSIIIRGHVYTFINYVHYNIVINSVLINCIVSQTLWTIVSLNTLLFIARRPLLFNTNKMSFIYYKTILDYRKFLHTFR